MKRKHIIMTDEGPLVSQAYVCKAKGEKLVLQDITLPALTATQVELDITHCGLCHTDIHMRDNGKFLWARDLSCSEITAHHSFIF